MISGIRRYSEGRLSMIALIVFQMLLNAGIPVSAGEDTALLRTMEYEYTVHYFQETANRIIPHGFIDQARESIVALHGPDALISFTRSFSVSPYTYGYTAHRSEDGVVLDLIVCSDSNRSFITVTGTCSADEWRRELFDLLWRSTEQLEKLDKELYSSEHAP